MTIKKEEIKTLIYTDENNNKQKLTFSIYKYDNIILFLCAELSDILGKKHLRKNVQNYSEEEGKYVINCNLNGKRNARNLFLTPNAINRALQNILDNYKLTNAQLTFKNWILTTYLDNKNDTLDTNKVKKSNFHKIRPIKNNPILTELYDNNIINIYGSYEKLLFVRKEIIDVLKIDEKLFEKIEDSEKEKMEIKLNFASECHDEDMLTLAGVFAVIMISGGDKGMSFQKWILQVVNPKITEITTELATEKINADMKEKIEVMETKINSIKNAEKVNRNEHIYIIQDPHEEQNVYKIGKTKSKNIEERFKQYNVGRTDEIIKHGIFSCHNSKLCENVIKEILKSVQHVKGKEIYKFNLMNLKCIFDFVINICDDLPDIISNIKNDGNREKYNGNMIRNYIRTIYNSNPLTKGIFQDFCKTEVINDINNSKNRTNIIVAENGNIVSKNEYIISRKEKLIDMNYVNHKIKLIEDFVEKNDRLPPQCTEILGPFIDKQREDYKKGIIIDSIKAKLEKIPYWTWYPIDDDFDNKCKELEKFIDVNKRLPDHRKNDNGIIEEEALSDFCRHLRVEYRKKIINSDKYEKISKICNDKSINFNWSGIQNNKWDDNFEIVKEFYDEHKRLPKSNENAAGSWIYEQAKKHRNAGNCKGQALAPDKISKFNDAFGNAWILPPSKRQKK